MYRLAPHVKNCLPMQEIHETQFLSLSHEDALEKEIATHPSILAWKFAWTEEPGGLWSMGSQSWTCLSNWTPSSIPMSTI